MLFVKRVRMNSMLLSIEAKLLDFVVYIVKITGNMKGSNLNASSAEKNVNHLLVEKGKKVFVL